MNIYSIELLITLLFMKIFERRSGEASMSAKKRWCRISMFASEFTKRA